MSRILVAFDYFAPNYPVLNNQNFDKPLTKLVVDNGTFEFFNNLNGFECVPSLLFFGTD
jgi:hypothetical protein